MLTFVESDPFELPEWLGVGEVVWSADSGLRTGHRVRGTLRRPDAPDVLPCDLLAVDVAYPEPVVPDGPRLGVHRAWHDGQVHVGQVEGRLTLGVPGTLVGAEMELDALERLARAVGGHAEGYGVLVGIGGGNRAPRP